VDVDGRHTDNELRDLAAALPPGAAPGCRVADGPLTDWSIDELRAALPVGGCAGWLLAPSDVFTTLLDDDRHRGGAWVYCQRALDIAHAVASSDRTPLDVELAAISRFRGMLVDHLRASSQHPIHGCLKVPEAPTRHPTPGVAPADGAPPRVRSKTCWPRWMRSSASPSQAEVRLVADLLESSAGSAPKRPPHDARRCTSCSSATPEPARPPWRLLAEIYRSAGALERGHLVGDRPFGARGRIRGPEPHRS
jgi:hypothetical protein